MAKQQLGVAPSNNNDAVRLIDISGLSGGASQIVVHGANPNTARPNTTSPVIWYGSVDPVNADDTKDVTVYVQPDNGFVGNSTTGYDVVLMIGQSNMSGRGTVDTVNFDLPNPMVDQFAANGPVASVISAAVEPLGHADYTALANKLGPGTAFGRWYSTIMAPGRRLLLVPAAYGGTPLVSTATLGWRRGITGNLYDQALNQVIAALAYAGSNSQLVAALWIQGEQDGNVSISGSAYQTDLDALINGLRTDTGVPNLPFIIGQMVPEYLGTGTRAAIDTVHAGTPARISNTAYVFGPSNQNMGDGNHYNAAGQRLMGRYMFQAFRSITAGAPLPTKDDGNLSISNTVAPVVTGTKTVGSTLTTTNGTWSPTPTSYSYQWYSGGVAVAGATASTYVLTPSDIGSSMTVQVTARISGYPNNTVPSAATTIVAGATTYAADNFTRSNAATLGTTSTGAKTWTNLSGTWGISSNQAYDTAPVTSTNHHAVFDDAQADGTIRLVIGAAGTAAGNGGIVVRATDDANLLLITTGADIYTRVAGVLTKIGGRTMTPVLANGDEFAVTLSGTNITVKYNGIVVNTASTTVQQTATKHGLRGYTASGITFASISHTT